MTIMPTNLSERNRLMQEDRDAGMSLSQLSKKYGLSKGRVSTLTHPANAYEEIIELPQKKANWSLWDEWRILNKKYGKRVLQNEQSSISDGDAGKVLYLPFTE